MASTDKNPLPAKIKKLRGEIDKIDNQLLKLLEQRVKLAQQVGKEKEQSGRGGAGKHSPVYLSPERQAEILGRVRDYAAARPKVFNSPAQLTDIFNEIISLCLNAEHLTKVVYLGPAGTYTQQAAIKYFGKSSAINPAHSIYEVFRQVEVGNSQYGVVPIENSSEGMVSNTMDVLATSKLKIVGEVKMPIHHCLLGHPWTKSLSDVKLVVSHQQSLAQCHLWLSEHLPNIELRAENSNARAAQQVTQTPGAAAIAGRLNAEIYGLNILAQKIEDQTDNSTRFFILGEQDTKPSGKDKTSIVVAAKNEPGSLYKLLGCFNAEAIDLNLLESHPTKMGDWQYNFFIDFYGHCQDKKVMTVLAALRRQASFLKVLGSYPCYINAD